MSSAEHLRQDDSQFAKPVAAEASKMDTLIASLKCASFETSQEIADELVAQMQVNRGAALAILTTFRSKAPTNLESVLGDMRRESQPKRTSTSSPNMHLITEFTGFDPEHRVITSHPHQRISIYMAVVKKLRKLIEGDAFKYENHRDFRDGFVRDMESELFQNDQEIKSVEALTRKSDRLAETKKFPMRLTHEHFTYRLEDKIASMAEELAAKTE